MKYRFLSTAVIASLGFYACTTKPTNTVQTGGGADTVTVTVATEVVKQRFPANVSAPAMTAANKTLWSKYCVGTPDSTDSPKPKYANKDVAAAAAKLSKVAPISFYYYSGPLNAYGLKKGQEAVLTGAPAGTTDMAHNFLSLLCGEFRDRATMIEAKIKWVNTINKLAVADNPKPFDLKKSIWSQITASQYNPYLVISQQLFLRKREDLAAAGNRHMKLNNSQVVEPIDTPVNGQTVCETNFIFSELIKKGQTTLTAAQWPEYKTKYAAFAAKCSANDKNYIYAFRGDSNFKPNSPESNGMIWHSSSVTNNCQTTTKAKTNENVNKLTTDQDCANYFRAPFFSRMNAARSGLATWMMRDPKHDRVFSNSSSPMFVIATPQLKAGPLEFKFSQAPGEKLADFMPINWAAPDLGFNAAAAGSQDFIYSRIRDGVNRHTDWYASGYYDEAVVPRKMGDREISQYKTEAYSPFVASSYVMAASDEFTSPGVTVSSQSDGRKHWMFVFKVHKDNWYTPESVKAGVPVDFNKHWFDETSFGTNSLADKERAWDRLGSPAETEFDSILYLHNITHPCGPATGGQWVVGSGEVVDDSQPVPAAPKKSCYEYEDPS